MCWWPYFILTSISCNITVQTACVISDIPPSQTLDIVSVAILWDCIVRIKITPYMNVFQRHGLFWTPPQEALFHNAH